MAVTSTPPIVAEFIAIQRCIDVHAVRWDVPTVLRNVMTPCEACTSWGKYVAGNLPALERDAARVDDSKLRAGVRRVLRECLSRRDLWAKSNGDCAVARAVAYQSIAGLLHRELDESVPS